jgi:multiple sugar transport system ATP-binding protein
MAKIEISNLIKRYDDLEVLHNLSFEIADKEFVVLVGPSGCGKTTLLRMIAGLEEVTQGKIILGERVINYVPEKDRDIAMVFQSYALYPHMTVRRNMSFSLRMRKMDKTEQTRRIEWAAEMLKLTEYLDRYPRQLSGGHELLWGVRWCENQWLSYLTNHCLILMPSFEFKCALSCVTCTSALKPQWYM